MMNAGQRTIRQRTIRQRFVGQRIAGHWIVATSKDATLDQRWNLTCRAVIAQLGFNTGDLRLDESRDLSTFTAIPGRSIVVWPTHRGGLITVSEDLARLDRLGHMGLRIVAGRDLLSSQFNHLYQLGAHQVIRHPEDLFVFAPMIFRHLRHCR
jgi:hypothetical protein